MRRSCYFYWLTFLLVGFHSTCAPAQTIYMHQGFEDTGGESLPYTPDIAPYGSGTVPTWNRVNGMYHIPDAAEGEFFWAARDVENAVSGSPEARLRFDAGEICHFTSARFVFAYQIVGYDGGDDFGYELFLDGFPHHRKILVDGVNGGGVSTEGWIYDTIPIPGTAHTAALEIFFNQNGDDVAGVDHLQLIASGEDGNCEPVCGIRTGEPRINCLSFTNGPDALRLTLPYTGAETGAVVFTSEGVVGGDDPAVQVDGLIRVDGYTEGAQQLLTIQGGDCDIVVPLEFPHDQCEPSDVVINEVMAAPAHDVNGDGVVDPGDEFVEIYNAGQLPYDLSGHTVHDGSNSGARFTFPAGSELAPAESFVVFAAPPDESILPEVCHVGTASGFLGLNDDTAESVILRNADGKVVAQADFDDAPEGESLTLYPDGNLAGGYHPHTSVDGEPASACAASVNLPVVLTQLSATSLYDAVRIDWATESEWNNRIFVVERSKSGAEFSEIGRVLPGNGTYVYVDYTPFPGLNYYRLRQVDHDGHATYYGPVSVRLDSGSIRLFPNPTPGRIRLFGDIPKDQPYEVFHADGRPALTGSGRVVDAAHLPAGVYYLRLPRRSEASSFRFIKE